MRKNLKRAIGRATRTGCPSKCGTSNTRRSRRKNGSTKCILSALQPGAPLPNGGDGMKLVGGGRADTVRLEKGRFVAIYPGEAHRVGGQTVPGRAETLTKWVVKLPCPEAFCL